MQKFLSSAVFFLMSLPVLAATQEEKANAPAETVDMIYVVIFAVLFVGMIVGFFVYLYMSDKEPNSDK